MSHGAPSVRFALAKRDFDDCGPARNTNLEQLKPMSQPTPTPEPVSTSRSFTVKSIAVGLLAAVAITVAAGLNNIMREWQTPLIGHYLPAAPLLLLIGLVLGWNPTVGRWLRLRFSAGELVVVFGLCLVCAWIPHGGFGRFFYRAIALPPMQLEAHPEWRHADTMGHLPPDTMPLRGSVVAIPLSSAIAAERSALDGGTLQAELAGAGVSPADYAAALELAALVPPREFLGDQRLARTGAGLAWQRQAGRASPGVGRLLEQMPEALSSAADAPAAWRLAYARLAAATKTLLPAQEKIYERTYPGFMNGLQSGDAAIGVSEVPYSSWMASLVFWLPLIICGAVASLMLALVVHRQWASHEQLAYPIATIASSLIGKPGEAGLPSVFRSRLFWWGFFPVIAVHGLNLLAIQLPGTLPAIPLQWSNTGALKEMFPITTQSGGLGGLQNGGIYFAIIGLTYFIATEISLSVGISGVVILLFSMQWYLATGSSFDGGSTKVGSFLAFAAIILFTGRHYYWAVLVAAFGRKRPEVAAEQAWAARGFLLAAVGFVTVLVGAFGMDWLVAICFSLTLLVLLLVVSRIVCETGLPFVQAGWAPAQVVSTVLGFGAVGPASLVSMYLVGAALVRETRESLLPFANTAFKIADNTGTPRLPLAMLGIGAMVVALGAGIIASLWGLYNFGAGRDSFAFWPGADALDQSTRGLNHLIETGRYAESSAASGLEKLGQISHTAIQLEDLGWIAFGAVLVFGFSACRFRWTWFPLHPMMFVVMGSWVSARIWFSVLLGWAIKVAIVRFAGGKVYQDLKPLFIGLIIGELSMAIITIVHPWTVYLITGTMPPIMGMFPS